MNPRGVFKRHAVNRRAFLYGAGGIAIGLPFLEGLPERSAWAAGAEPVFTLFMCAACAGFSANASISSRARRKVASSSGFTQPSVVVSIASRSTVIVRPRVRVRSRSLLQQQVRMHGELPSAQTSRDRSRSGQAGSLKSATERRRSAASCARFPIDCAVWLAPCEVCAVIDWMVFIVWVMFDAALDCCFAAVEMP